MNENVDLPPTYLSLVGVLVFQSYVHTYVEYIIVLSQLAKRMIICSLSIIIAERMKGSQRGVGNSGEWVRSDGLCPMSGSGLCIRSASNHLSSGPRNNFRIYFVVHLHSRDSRTNFHNDFKD